MPPPPACGDLDLCPFELWVGSQVIRVMNFLPANVQLPVPFRSQLRVCTRQTDGGMDSDNGHQCVMLPPYGSGAY